MEGAVKAHQVSGGQPARIDIEELVRRAYALEGALPRDLAEVVDEAVMALPLEAGALVLGHALKGTRPRIPGNISDPRHVFPDFAWRDYERWWRALYRLAGVLRLEGFEIMTPAAEQPPEPPQPAATSRSSFSA